MLEKLYQDVWTQVFAATWAAAFNEALKYNDELIGPEDPKHRALLKEHCEYEATHAAASALAAWDPAKAHAAVCAAQGLTPIEAAAATQEGE